MSSSDQEGSTNSSDSSDTSKYSVFMNMIQKIASERIQCFVDRSLTNFKILEDYIVHSDVLEHSSKKAECISLLSDARTNMNVLTMCDINYFTFFKTLQMQPNTRTSIIYDVLAYMRVLYDTTRDMSEIYNKKYDIINTLKETVEKFNSIILSSGVVHINDFMGIAIAHLNLGIMYANCMSEISLSDVELTTCTKLLQGIELNPNAVVAAITALHQLYINSANRDGIVQRKIFLEKAEDIYLAFKAVGDCPNLISVECTCLDIERDGLSPEDTLEELHILTLDMLKEFYNVIMKDKPYYMIYFHRMLEKQLLQSENGKNVNFNYTKWALNAAKLANVFIENHHFSQARHHLAAASYMLKIYGTTLKLPMLSTNIPTNIKEACESHYYIWARVAIYWGKYGISLLCASNQRLLRSSESEDEESSIYVLSRTSNDDSRLIAHQIFEDLTSVLGTYTDLITDQYVTNYTEAKLVFTHIQIWLSKATDYFLLDDPNCAVPVRTEFRIKIAQYFSAAYKYLAVYENDINEQDRIYKERTNILESVVSKLDKTWESVCIEMWSELGIIYSNRLAIIFEQLGDHKPNTKIKQEMKELIRNSVKYFRLCLNSLHDTSDQESEDI